MHIKYRILILFFFIISFDLSIVKAKSIENKDTINLIDGDLLFQDLDCGPFCDAIEEVTFGINNSKLSHIGIVVVKADSIFVIEAVSKGVCLTSLQDFLSRSYDETGKPKVIVGRLKNEFQYLIPQALIEANTLIGKPYDDVFDIENDKFYCSELIYNIFFHANNNKPLFEVQPMTFKSPKTGKTFDIWIEYFKNLNISVPEGKLGINPGTISRSAVLDVFYPYGNPEGLISNY